MTSFAIAKTIDSVSSLKDLNEFQLERDLVRKIIEDYTSLTNADKRPDLCWIPSPVNIPGNERTADSAPKWAISLRITSMELPAHRLIPRVSRFCLKE